MSYVKVGLTGLGRIGKIHLRNLVDRVSEVEVVAVSDVLPDTASIAKQHNVADFYTEFDSVLAIDEIDAVIICSPTGTHLEYIRSAAAAGKHIFCEKPLEMTVEKIREIEEAVQRHDVKLQVGFNRRFDPGFARIRKRVLENDIGDMQILNITSRDPAPPPLEYLKGSGGLFLDMTIHDFDMARFVAGCEVTEVYASGSALFDETIAEVGDVDTAVVLLKFENGATAIINNSRKSVYGYDQRLEVFGTMGMANLDNHYLDTHRFYNHEGGHSPLALDFFLERYEDAYLQEMNAFVEAVRLEQPIPVGVFDALQATRIALAAQRSMTENLPIKFSEIK